MAVAVGAATLGASESAAYRCSSVSAVAEGAGSAASEASGMPQQLTQEQWEQRFRQWQQHFLSVLQQQGGEQAEQQSMQIMHDGPAAHQERDAADATGDHGCSAAFTGSSGSATGATGVTAAAATGGACGTAAPTGSGTSSIM